MATKVAIAPEKLYECEVKRRRVRVGGGYEPFWKVKTVADAILDRLVHGAYRIELEGDSLPRRRHGTSS